MPPEGAPILPSELALVSPDAVQSLNDLLRIKLLRGMLLEGAIPPGMDMDSWAHLLGHLVLLLQYLTWKLDYSKSRWAASPGPGVPVGAFSGASVHVCRQRRLVERLSRRRVRVDSIEMDCSRAEKRLEAQQGGAKAPSRAGQPPTAASSMQADGGGPEADEAARSPVAGPSEQQRRDLQVVGSFTHYHNGRVTAFPSGAGDQPFRASQGGLIPSPIKRTPGHQPEGRSAAAAGPAIPTASFASLAGVTAAAAPVVVQRPYRYAGFQESIDAMAAGLPANPSYSGTAAPPALATGSVFLWLIRAGSLQALPATRPRRSS